MKRFTLMLALSALFILVGWLSVAAQACEVFTTTTGHTIAYCPPVPTETPTATETATPAPTWTPTPVATPKPPTATPAQPTATPVIVPAPTQPPAGVGLWISAAEVAALPTNGAAWAQMQTAANAATCTPNLSNQDDPCNVNVMAAGLVYARLHDNRYRDLVVTAISKVTNTQSESGGRTLALGRELAAYVIAADLINLRTVNPSLDAQFRTRLIGLRSKVLDGKTLMSCHSQRPNNWGTMCGGSLAAIAAYLGETAELTRIATIFRGYLGDRSAYAGFTYGSDVSWHCDSTQKRGINPDCQKQGHAIGGVPPDDMRRGGPFQWPPSVTGYPYEGLQGAVTQAELLHRAGLPAWQWSDRAICREVAFLYSIGWQPSGDDLWQIPLVNRRCGTTYATSGLGTPGKIAGWAFWTHGASAAAFVEPQAAPAARGAILEQRVVIASSPGDLADEVAYLAGFGWVADGKVQKLAGDDGPVWSRVVVR